MSTATPMLTGERADLAQTLAKQRHFLRYTTRDMSDEQAAQRTTVSELCLGGIIKHVAAVERQWARFIVEGPSAMGNWDDGASMQDYLDGFRMLPGETLAGLLADYERAASETDDLIAKPSRSGRCPAAAAKRPGTRRALAGRHGASCCT